MQQASIRYRRILFVCHANTSRSIIAEALLRRMLTTQAPSETVHIYSGGIAAYARDGALASLDARLVLRDEGIELTAGTSSTDLKNHPELVEEADLILAMTEQQLEMLRSVYPRVESKPLYTLRSFAGYQGDIDDPVGKSEAVFAACLAEIKQCLERAMPRFLLDTNRDDTDLPESTR
jgi:protein-tyrosine phosphatase